MGQTHKRIKIKQDVGKAERHVELVELSCLLILSKCFQDLITIFSSIRKQRSKGDKSISAHPRKRGEETATLGNLLVQSFSTTYALFKIGIGVSNSGGYVCCFMKSFICS